MKTVTDLMQDLIWRAASDGFLRDHRRRAERGIFDEHNLPGSMIKRLGELDRELLRSLSASQLPEPIPHMLFDYVYDQKLSLLGNKGVETMKLLMGVPTRPSRKRVVRLNT